MTNAEQLADVLEVELVELGALQQLPAAQQQWLAESISATKARKSQELAEAIQRAGSFLPGIIRRQFEKIFK